MTKNLRIVCYTANFGDRKDPLIEPICCDETCDWVYFTDVKAKSKKWTVKYATATGDGRHTARQFKLQPHIFLPNYDVWFWMDANLLPKYAARKVVSDVLPSDNILIAMHKHSERKTLHEELRACTRLNKDHIPTMEKQVRGYYDGGFKDDGTLPETGILVRRNHPKVVQFNNLWWKEVSQKSVRDQLSVNYALQKAGLSYNVIRGKCKVSPNFYFVPHK